MSMIPGKQVGEIEAKKVKVTADSDLEQEMLEIASQLEQLVATVNSLAIGSIQNPVIMTSGQDLNTLRAPGFYECSAAVSATLSNCPTNTAFSMLIRYGDRTVPLMIQEITEIVSDPTMFIRAASSATTWSGWHKQILQPASE